MIEKIFYLNDAGIKIPSFIWHQSPIVKRIGVKLQKFIQSRHNLERGNVEY